MIEKTKLAKISNISGGWILEIEVTDEGHLDIIAYNRTNVAMNSTIRLLNINPNEIKELGTQLIENASKQKVIN